MLFCNLLWNVYKPKGRRGEADTSRLLGKVPHLPGPRDVACVSTIQIARSMGQTSVLAKHFLVGLVEDRDRRRNFDASMNSELVFFFWSTRLGTTHRIALRTSSHRRWDIFALGPTMANVPFPYL